MKRLTIALLALLTASVTPAQPKLESGKDPSAAPVTDDGLRLHNLFQSNMVLQRDKPVKIWGWAGKGDTITVEFAGQTKTAKVGNDGAWQVMLDTMPACATGRTLTVTCHLSPAGQQDSPASAAITCQLQDVLVGDIWVMGGQSNMQHPLSRVEEGAVEIVCAQFPKIRLLTIPAIIDNNEKKNFPRRQGEQQPDGDWDVCTPESVPEFTGIGYIFARRIHMASQIPVGVIDVSYWGTTLESWTPRAVLKSMDSEVVRALFAEWDKKVAEWDPQKDLENRIKRYNERKAEKKASSDQPPSDLRPGPQDDQNYPGNCYASILSPIEGFAVKGAVWHQGYNNARPDAAQFYYQVFPKMIASWRAAFNDPGMPFGIISLCTDSTPQTFDNYLECMLDWGIYVREAQYKTFLDLCKAGDKNIGFASSFDHRRAWYHPQQKIPAAERIARWAMATQYGFTSVSWKPPMVTKMEIKNGTIMLHMDKDVASVDSQAIAGFAIAGKDGKYQPAQAESLVIGKDGENKPQYDGKILVLSSPHVANPIHFRYAWGRNPMGNLRVASTEEKDNAFAAQRSDNWTWSDMYESYTGKKCAVPGVISGAEINELRKALQAADLERQIAEARSLLETRKRMGTEKRK